MFRGRPLWAVFTILIVLVLFSSSNYYYCDAGKNLKKNNKQCLLHPSSCGNIHNISFPFRLSDDPQNCGDKNYELSCENNIHPVLYLNSGKYYVRDINYTGRTIRLVHAGIEKDSCSTVPHNPLTYWNFSRFEDPFYWLYYKGTTVAFLNCEKPVKSPLYMYMESCTHDSNSSNFSSVGDSGQYSYVLAGELLNVSDVADSCSVDMMVVVPSLEGKNYSSDLSFSDIHKELAKGFELSWTTILCAECKGRYSSCELDGDSNVKCYNTCYPHFRSLSCIFWDAFFWLPTLLYYGIVLHFAAKIIIGMPCVFIFLLCKWRRRHLSMFDAIEGFLRSQNNLMPINYSYSNIKKMTKGFKDKLGEGGYGSVYKGKLRSGGLAAVKVLSKPKANGQEFISEVATIGRIHHVNVVQLIGYCAERSKRALVYEFMPNGSLEKYIFSREESIFLSYEKLYEISLGVARGIEYLHRGCDMQILHFDIKPHNILLDKNFNPKVSDFGLAKFYPTDGGTFSMTAARGTMGYMAPELFYKNIGGVSYKADVYSFGMLLMEMASRRKNLNPLVDQLSQIYFPSWVYDQFNEGNDIEMRDATEEEKKMVKKMIVVALWCIQMKPSDRPSMNKVVEMLEGDIELLRMPPKPFICPQEMPEEDHTINADTINSPILSGNFISLDVHEN